MKNIVDRIGLPALLEQTAEECAELAHACLKEARRMRGDNPTPCTDKECGDAVEEEMADVKICLRLLSDSGYTPSFAAEMKKLDRWHQRLDEVGK